MCITYECLPVSASAYSLLSNRQTNKCHSLLACYNCALQLSHILCFIKVSSSVYENLLDSISSFEVKFSWTKFSLLGICFSSVHTSIFVNLVLRKFFYFCMSRFAHLKFCMWYFFQNLCQIFKHC